MGLYNGYFVPNGSDPSGTSTASFTLSPEVTESLSAEDSIGMHFRFTFEYSSKDECNKCKRIYVRQYAKTENSLSINPLVEKDSYWHLDPGDNAGKEYTNGKEGDEAVSGTIPPNPESKKQNNNNEFNATKRSNKTRKEDQNQKNTK